MMSSHVDFYDSRYSAGYRRGLSGFEIARWHALEHLIGTTLRLQNAPRVLDYGSGSGLHIDLWKKVFPRADLWFCDISTVALQQLAARCPEFKERTALVAENRARLDEGGFDVVVSVEVMEHVEHLDDYLVDVYRLLKPGGMFIWTTPCANPFSIEHLAAVLLGGIEKTGDGYRRWKWEDRAHVRRLRSREVRSLLLARGFSNVNFRFRSHFFSFFCTTVLRGRLGKTGERLMLLDYALLRNLPNGASMIGFCRKEAEEATRRAGSPAPSPASA